MLVMVGLVAVVLVIAGAGSLILTRNAARNQAQQQLVSEAESLTSKDAPQHLGVLAAIKKTLKLEDADLITITALGNVVTALPAGLTAQDIDVAGLQSGQTSSGRTGNLVYAAAPVTLTEAERVKLAKAAHHPRLSFRGTLAVLLTRATSVTWGRAGGTSSSPGERRCWSPRWWPGRCRVGWPGLSSRPWRPRAASRRVTSTAASPSAGATIPSSPRWPAPSTAWPRACRTAAPGSVTFSCRCRTTCAPRSRPSAASPRPFKTGPSRTTPKRLT